METLGQDRMRSLKTNYRRNKIKLAILITLASLLLAFAAYQALKITGIKNAVIKEHTHYITEAAAEREEANAAYTEIRARYDEVYADNIALEAELNEIKNAN